MKQLYLTILLFLILINNASSQNKIIRGDTSFWYSWSRKLAKKLEVSDFNESQVDFSFRFWNSCQIVEIKKNDNQFSGELTNFVYVLNRQGKLKKILFEKVPIDSNKVHQIYLIVQNSGIISLKSDNEIEGWSLGCDGETYIIEFSDTNEYWFKHYWTPSAQDSIPEALIIMKFVKDFSDTLQLKKKYEQFLNTLPEKDCYNAGGLLTLCFIANSYEFGYSGSVRLPYGYYALMNFAYIGKVQTDFGLEIQQKFDKNKNTDLMVTFGKGNFLIHNKNFSDFFRNSFRYRRLSFIDSVNSFQNYQFYYGLSLKNNFDLAIGLDFMFEKEQKMGKFVYVSKYFSKPRLAFMIKTSIFSNEINYKFGVSRTFKLKRSRLLDGISTGLYYENFKNYNDWGMTLSLVL